ncbi:MAG: hypothetical protein OXG24_01250 [Gammaproteobacteria bacterium]|nr:hypothetical protein [Gammaproteobacteria bacterium]
MSKPILKASFSAVKYLLITSIALTLQPVWADDYYLRLGLGLDRPSDAIFSDRNCLNLFPWALYGCGEGPDGFPYRSVGEFEQSRTFQFGLGYSPTQKFRVELLAERRNEFEFVGRANFLATEALQDVATPVESTTGLLIAYREVANWNIGPLGDLSPYAGLGFGFVRNTTAETRMDFPFTITTLPEGSTLDLAGLVAVGISSSLGTQRLNMDFELRYTYLGEVESGRDVGYVTWRNGRRDPLALDLDLTQSRLKRLAINVSIRFSL